MLDMASLSAQRDHHRVQFYADQQPVLSGQLHNETFHNGLSLHCSDMELSHRVQSHAEFKPGIKLIIMLQGCISMKLGGVQHAIDAHDCLLLASTAAEPYSRAMLALGSQQQIVLNIPPTWFDDGGYSQMSSFQTTAQFCRKHLAHQQWQASPQLRHLSRALLQDRDPNDHLHKLRRECHTLELLLAGIAPIATSQQTTLDARGEKRIQTLLEMLHSGEADQLSLAQMANAVGSNATTLQKQFRQKMGASIFDYLRSHKLAQARQDLQQGMNISDAAQGAGYSSAANFSTAFKRQFGFSPKVLARS